jgi:hypothetical protein
MYLILREVGLILVALFHEPRDELDCVNSLDSSILKTQWYLQIAHAFISNVHVDRQA